MWNLERKIYLIGGVFHGDERMHPARETTFAAFYTEWHEDGTAVGVSFVYTEVYPKSGIFVCTQ
jgi:hypothetical protein